MKKIFSKAFNINEGEHGRVFLSWLIFLIVMSGIIIGRNARDSIFLVNVGIAYLPYMYVLNAVFVVIVSIIYSSFIDKMDRTRFMVASTALYAIIVALTRVFLAMQMQWFYSVCYVIVQILWLIGLMQFWTFMGDVFDARESKRLFPLISTGGLVGMIVAGFGAKYVVAAIGTENLFLLWAGMLGISIALIIVLSNKYIKPRAAAAKTAAMRPAPKKSQVQEFKEGFEYLKSVPLLRNMVFINLAMWAVFTIVDYQFNKVMHETYPQKDDLTAFLGMFRAAAGVICLTIQLGVTSRLVSRFGVGRTIAVHPVFMGAATAFLTLKFGYISSFVSKIGDHSLLYTIQDSSYQMLYNPIPIDKRGRARAFVEGYIKPISMGIAGVVLIISAKLLTNPQTSFIAFLFAVVWVIFSLRANASYVKALTANLTAPDLHLRAEALHHLSKLSDSDNLRALREVLKSNDREMILFALEMIESLEAKEAAEDVRQTLASPDKIIRAAAISALSTLGDKQSLANIAELLGDVSSHVRAAAVKTLGRLGDGDVFPMLTPALEDPELIVRAEAITALIRAGGLDGILLAGDSLKKMLASADTEERSLAADVLGSIRVKHFTPTLLKLMADPEPAIRDHAIKAVAKLQDERAIGPLIDALGDKFTAIHAKQGLALLLEKALPELIAAAAGSPNADIRRRSVKLLGKIPSKEAAETIVGALKDSSSAVCGAALDTLPMVPLPESQKQILPPKIIAYINEEIKHICDLRRSEAFLISQNSGKTHDVVLGALDENARAGMDRVFRGLALVFDRKAIQGVWFKLKSNDPRVKPIALEALDNIAPKDITRKIMPLFEDMPPQDVIAFCNTVIPKEQLSVEILYGRFASDASIWMRGCAAYSIGLSGDARLEPILDVLLADSDPFVRETAELAHRRAGGQNQEVMNMLLSMEKILFMKSAPIFAGMAGEELRALAEIVDEVSFKKDSYIFREGEPGEEMFVIVRGSAQVIHEEAGREKVLATLAERDCLGEMSILDDEPRSASARVLDDTVTLRISRDDFHELIKEVPEVAFGVFRVFTGRIRHANIEQEKAFAPMQGTM
ncbi:MAG: Npt1/Npt2 family nucleotide transporter [bacterium]